MKLMAFKRHNDAFIMRWNLGVACALVTCLVVVLLSSRQHSAVLKLSDPCLGYLQAESKPTRFNINEVSNLTVTVAHPGIFWWVRDYGVQWQVPGCKLRGKPLHCEFISIRHAEGNAAAELQLRKAMALVHEGCWSPDTVDAGYKHLPQVQHSSLLHCWQMRHVCVCLHVPH